MVFPAIYSFSGELVSPGDTPPHESTPERMSFLCLGVPYTAAFSETASPERDAFFRLLSRTERKREEVPLEEVLRLVGEIFPGTGVPTLLSERGQVYIKREQLLCVLQRIARLHGGGHPLQLSFWKSRHGVSLCVRFLTVFAGGDLSSDAVSLALFSDRFLYRYLLALALAGGFELRAEEREGTLSLRIFLPFRSADMTLYADPLGIFAEGEETESEIPLSHE